MTILMRRMTRKNRIRTPQDDGQDDDDDCHWGGSEQHSQGQPEEGASMVKAILSQMRKLAEENYKENNENLR